MKKQNFNNRETAGDALIDNLRKIIRDKKVSQLKLAKITGIPRGTLSVILIGRSKRIEWFTLYRLAKGLGCLMEDIIEGGELGVIDNPEVRQLLDAMPSEAKLFFRNIKHIPNDDVEMIIKMMKIINEKYGKKYK